MGISLRLPKYRNGIRDQSVSDNKSMLSAPYKEAPGVGRKSVLDPLKRKVKTIGNINRIFGHHGKKIVQGEEARMLKAKGKWSRGGIGLSTRDSMIYPVRRRTQTEDEERAKFRRKRTYKVCMIMFCNIMQKIKDNKEALGIWTEVLNGFRKKAVDIKVQEEQYGDFGGESKDIESKQESAIEQWSADKRKIGRLETNKTNRSLNKQLFRKETIIELDRQNSTNLRRLDSK
jgi:hypothetical protein